MRWNKAGPALKGLKFHSTHDTQAQEDPPKR